MTGKLKLIWKHSRIQESFYITVDFLKEKVLKYNHYYVGVQIIPWFIDSFLLTHEFILEIFIFRAAFDSS